MADLFMFETLNICMDSTELNKPWYVLNYRIDCILKEYSIGLLCAIDHHWGLHQLSWFLLLNCHSGSQPKVAFAPVMT
jgi:hypothetical protein